jgi:hypothetical protein
VSPFSGDTSARWVINGCITGWMSRYTLKAFLKRRSLPGMSAATAVAWRRPASSSTRSGRRDAARSVSGRAPDLTVERQGVVNKVGVLAPDGLAAVTPPFYGPTGAKYESGSSSYSK